MRTHRSCVCSGAVGSLQLEKCSDIVSLMDVTGGSQEKLVMTLIGVLLRGRGQELINLMDRCMGDAARTEEKPAAVKKLVKVWLRLVQQDLSASARNLNSFAPPTKPHRKVLAPAFFNFDSPWLVAPLQPSDGITNVDHRKGNLRLVLAGFRDCPACSPSLSVHRASPCTPASAISGMWALTLVSEVVVLGPHGVFGFASVVVVRQRRKARGGSCAGSDSFPELREPANTNLQR
eukprot:GHVU01095162.1.p1 GENE.GHVU01095162.1~~GHVU01095162.1.p1  ORF type:complete len:234 (-),score=16.02 GHVU01095162.1:93-794(-)